MTATFRVSTDQTAELSPLGANGYTVRTHAGIDARSLAMVRLIVTRVDADPEAGLARARAVCDRWLAQGAGAAAHEWRALLDLPWQDVRSLLLDPGEEGQRLRQSDPFCGFLTQEERLSIYREYAET